MSDSTNNGKLLRASLETSDDLKNWSKLIRFRGKSDIRSIDKKLRVKGDHRHLWEYGRLLGEIGKYWIQNSDWGIPDI
jgi:hypothetical protein